MSQECADGGSGRVVGRSQQVVEFNVVRVLSGEEEDWDAGFIEASGEPVCLRGVVGMRSNVENQEGRYILTRHHVVDCGKCGVFFGCVPKLLAVAKLSLGLLMDASSCFRGFDDGGNVVCVSVDRNATDDVFERDAFSFGVRLVAAKKCGELCARRVSAYEYPVWVAAEIANVFSNPAESLGHVSDERIHFYVGQKPMVDRHKNEAF